MARKYRSYSEEDIKNDLLRLLPMMEFFSHLSIHSEIFIFVREMKWMGDNGQKQFNEMYENVTNVLLADSESYEMAILDCLEPTVRILSTIGDITKEQSFTEAFGKIKRHQEIMDAAKVKQVRNNFKVVQENISSIRDWFDSGMDEISTIFCKYEAVMEQGEYIIENKELCLRYVDTQHGKSGGTISLIGKALSEFIQQLGFIKHENYDMSENISSFVDQFHLLEDILQNKAKVTAVGFDETKYIFFPCDARPSELVENLYQKSKEMVDECEIWLDNLYKKYPTSLLFWTEELRIIHNAMEDALSSNSQRHLISLVMNTFHLRRDLSVLTMAKSGQIVNYLQSIDFESNWLNNVSLFIEFFHNYLGAPFSQQARKETAGSSGIFLHSMDCDNDLKTFLCLFIISNIFEVSRYLIRKE